MTLKEALESICAEGVTWDATKRDAMGGYVFCYGETATEGVFRIRLRKRNDVTSTPVDYAYTYTPETGEFVFVASEAATTDLPASQAATPSLSAELLGELTADDWKIGKASDFENSRTGGGGDEW
jgi:hypothetical protein